MILLVDNYDSFTYNLYQYFAELGLDCLVKRNDQITVEEIKNLRDLQHIVLSPGPGNPDSAGITLEVIKELSGQIPIFGVCLGHQAIGQAFGGDVIRAPRARHGKISKIQHKGQGVFAGLPRDFEATRYHSLVVDESSLPSCLEVTARSEDGLIMGLKHKTLNVEGVQFHPESIATVAGKDLLKNVVQKRSGSRHE